MERPTLKEEKKLWRRGFKFVIGLDEAGRGPLAGPVVAGAILLREDKLYQNLNLKFLLKEVRDSKKLSADKRKELYKILTKHPAIVWGVGKVSEKIIDKINILEATKLAMVKAIKKINAKIARTKNKLGFLIIDGNFILSAETLAKAGFVNLSQKSIIKADNKVFSCAAASIIAKVTRDKIMEKYDKKYPQYNFSKHKGYGTKLHLEKIKKYGLSPIHRKTFYPVKTYVG